MAVVSRTEANSQKTADAINAVSPEAAKPYAVDVADFDAVQKTGEGILADFGRCDVLVNNAGITRDTLIMRMNSEDWDVVLDTNLKGAFNFSRAVLRAMVKQRKGRIINIGSVSGLIGLAGQANYSASKAGLVGTDQDAGARAREPQYHGKPCRAGIRRDRHDFCVGRRRPQSRPFADSPDTIRRRGGYRRRRRFSCESRSLLRHRAGARSRWRNEHVAIRCGSIPAWPASRFQETDLRVRLGRRIDV